VITRFLLDQAGLKAEQGDSGAFTLIQRFGSATNLNIHLHCLVLDGICRCDAEGVSDAVNPPLFAGEVAVLQTVSGGRYELSARK